MNNPTRERLIEEWVEIVLKRFSEITSKPIELPIPIVDIAELVFGLRCEITDICKGSRPDLIGLLLPRYRRIIVSNRSTAGRIAFTIAHEIAHWVLDCNNIDDHDHLYWIRSIRASGIESPELVADQVAATLLMPRRFLQAHIEQKSSLDIRAAQELSNDFGVSLTALITRVNKIQAGSSPLFIHVEWTDSQNSITSLAKSADQRTTEKYQWETRFKPWLPSTYIHIERKDNILLLDNIDRVDTRTIKQLCDLKQRSSSLSVISIGPSENTRALSHLRCVDAVYSATSKRELVSQIRTLKQRFGITFKFLILPITGWIYNAWFDLDSNLGRDEWIEYDDNTLSTFTRRRSSTKEQSAPISLQKAMPTDVVLHSVQEAANFIRQQKRNGKRVVLVTGCFDVLTAAHVFFLKQAKAAGDVLVIGVENDNRLVLLKGIMRPVNTISERIEVIEQVRFIDYTFVIRGFSSIDLKTFYRQLYTKLRPDYLAVTEGDPATEDRRQEIEAAGGELLITERYPLPVSTTSILKNVLAQHPELPQVWYITQPMLMSEQSGDSQHQQPAGPPTVKTVYSQLTLPLTD